MWLRKNDSGLRDLTGETDGVASGRLLIRRREGVVTLWMDELVLTGSGTVSLPRLPSGLRPWLRARGVWLPSTSSAVGGSIMCSTAGYLSSYSTAPGLAMSARVEWETVDAIPSTWPGVAV